MGVTMNHVPIRGILVLTCSLLGGCAFVGGIAVDAIYTAAFRTKIEDASDLSPNELRQLEQIPLYNADTGLIYRPVGQVNGLSCYASVLLGWTPALSELNGRTPQEAAIKQLRIQAMRAGANAVLNSTCLHYESIDWANNCWESWICVGDAIRVE